MMYVWFIMGLFAGMTVTAFMALLLFMLFLSPNRSSFAVAGGGSPAADFRSGNGTGAQKPGPTVSALSGATGGAQAQKKSSASKIENFPKPAPAGAERARLRASIHP